MLKLRIFLLLFCAFSVLKAQNNLSALIPQPNKVQPTKTVFKLNKNTVIDCQDDALNFALAELKSILKDRMQLDLNKSHSNDRPRSIIKLEIDPKIKDEEHYFISVKNNELKLKGSSKAAVLYAVMTLDQILLGDNYHTVLKEIAGIEIEDSPRFNWRSMMLDPARNFIPVKDVKYFIDLMMKYKYNILQLHLTDDEGWRVEIKSHPELTNIGAIRNPKKGMQGPENGFYSQNELKELVNYAAERNVQIIPEIDIPGHTASVLTAYPNLACTSADSIPRILGKSNNLMLCASKPEVYGLYKDVIRELAEIFPSKYIHLGGDESAIEKNWALCQHDQKLLQQLNYQKPAQLMNYFFDKIFKEIKANQKTPILWLELDNIRMPAKEYLFDYPKDAILITWRYGLTPLCIELSAKNENSLIMSPGEYAYFDYPQRKGDLPESNNWGMPITTLQDVINFDPGYGKPKKEQQHILGVNATLWGEAIPNIHRATYMAFPRALAFAEAGWTKMENRNSTSLMKRIYPNLMNLIQQKVWISTSFAWE